MALDGMGTEQIATALSEEHVLKPAFHCKTIGVNRPVASGDGGDPYYWSATAVGRILTMQEYCGDVLNFKTYSKSFKDKKRRQVPREEWAVFTDVHEPIIERPRRELVQSLLAKPKKRTSKTQRNIFSGLLRCADCGGNLTFHFNQRNNDITFYSCHAYNGL
jgi:hypothetical protein